LSSGAHGSPNQTGCQHIDSNAGLSIVSCRRPAHGFDRSLTGSVGDSCKVLRLWPLRQHTSTIKNCAGLRILCPEAEDLAAHQKCAFCIDLHGKVPGGRVTFVKRTVTSGASADPSDIKKGVNSPKPLQACNHRSSHHSFVTDICDGKRCFMNVCRHCLTFVAV